MVVEVKVGDVIKSLDFAGKESCYMIGKVIAILEDGELLNCKAIARVWDGVAKIVDNTADFSTYIEGDHFMDARFPGRITVIA